MMRRTWIDKGDTVALTWQCALAGVSRSAVYARQKPKPIALDDEVLKRLIDEEYTRHPFYGSRKMVVYLGRCGHCVNRKRAQRLMRSLGLAGMAPGPNTSRAHPKHKVYPYLLRGVAVVKPNQVWSTDITYIRLERGFAYLVAVIDWYSRRVLSWRISNSMEAVFCVDCLEDALRFYGKPEVFNTDQGSQFTSDAFTGVLKRAGVTISMDGRGRAFDNIFVERLWRSVKHEDVYLNFHSSMGELLIGLTKYFAFYNGERPHQALRNLTPDVVHQRAQGGGAMIVDNYGAAQGLPIALRSTGTAFDEVRLEKTEISKAKNRGSAVQLFVQSGAT
ncbi:Mobile element protein [Polaromonas sp. CG9_12]|nr:Mobile element protein [Polaromonas sp. CG9_12]